VRTISEAEALSTIDREILGRVKEAVRRKLPTARVFLYGSVARGTNGPESDYDFLVLTDRSLSTPEENAVYDELFEVELETERVISAMFCGLPEWEAGPIGGSPFHHEVERDAIAL
jgi:predicted nucleotidyltransferase